MNPTTTTPRFTPPRPVAAPPAAPAGETPEQKIARLEAALAQANAKVGAATVIKFKVSEKGGVSVYGLNARFPVTLYADQWERLLEQAEPLKEFIRVNRSSLSSK